MSTQENDGIDEALQGLAQLSVSRANSNEQAAQFSKAVHAKVTAAMAQGRPATEAVATAPPATSQPKPARPGPQASQHVQQPGPER